ncbi:putative acetyltransferase [Occultella kanbiaonis]|uniref:putative acetyltransferase n=1 Tax=Occultella kanbiaonis TaxID=2675754 RepID=UPI0012B7E0D4|nr:ferrous iron transport protein A [Occultella kanbiaonis]
MVDDGACAEPFWHDWQVGERVVVRYRLDAGGVSDALGELVRVDDAGVEVATRRGLVVVAAGDIALGKRVPPAPVPRRTRG